MLQIIAICHVYVDLLQFYIASVFIRVSIMNFLVPLKKRIYFQIIKIGLHIVSGYAGTTTRDFCKLL